MSSLNRRGRQSTTTTAQFLSVQYGNNVLEVPADVYVDGCEYVLHQGVLPDLSSRAAEVAGIQQAYTRTNLQRFEDITDKCRKTVTELNQAN